MNQLFSLFLASLLAFSPAEPRPAATAEESLDTLVELTLASEDSFPSETSDPLIGTVAQEELPTPTTLRGEEESFQALDASEKVSEPEFALDESASSFLSEEDSDVAEHELAQAESPASPEQPAEASLFSLNLVIQNEGQVIERRLATFDENSLQSSDDSDQELAQTGEVPKLCLHMIVKDEAHVIERCLASVKKLIDYWVIVDTGSTDGTQEIIKDYLKRIPGELHEIPWKNWGETRSEAIAFAKDKAEYILLMDADDILLFNGEKKLPDLTKDQYNMWRGSKGFTYQRPQIVKGDLPWRYLGVTHEYLDCPVPYTSETLETVKYITLDDGAMSRDSTTKFEKNIVLLEEGLKKEPKNGRYAFYLAESYRDAGQKGKALEMFQKRVDMGGWDQEIFWSKLQMAQMMKELKLPANVILEAYKDAHNYRPHRAEAVYYIAELLNGLSRHEEAYRILKAYELVEKPEEKDALFNVDWIPDYGLLFQLSICSYYVNHYEESLDACDALLSNKDLPSNWRTLAESNRTFPLTKLKEKLASK